MESGLGEETWGPTPNSLQESNISDLTEDALDLRPKDELETIPVEEIKGLKPEDLEESAPAEATQDTKPETGQDPYVMGLYVHMASFNYKSN
ncbi:hypothetical protein AV530_014313 [Patagioenas fasciata monilis]|uniref:Uncharacterized protein n=1 Tax=Patagioenas fasciata monilis TaxID=372326 RepID=A0A1V4KBM7_PATFA|nr:hypothetical protein AV530_014313 [Patagioenas fasciata monilis]